MSLGVCHSGRAECLQASVTLVRKHHPAQHTLGSAPVIRVLGEVTKGSLALTLPCALHNTHFLAKWLLLCPLLKEGLGLIEALSLPSSLSMSYICGAAFVT